MTATTSRFVAAAIAAVVVVGGAGIAIGNSLANTAVALTAYTGPSQITSCQTIDHKIITGGLTIAVSNGNKAIYNNEVAAQAASCVKLTNDVVNMTNPGNGQKAIDVGYTSFRSCNNATTPCGPVYLADTTINVGLYTGAGGGYTYGLGSTNVHAWRITVLGGPQGLTCDGWCEIHDSTLTADHASGGSHMDAIISNGNEAPMLFDGNTLRCEEDGGFAVTSSAGCSAPIGLFGDNDPITNVTVNNNLFAGTSSGHYCSYTGASQPAKAHPTGTSIVWTNNTYSAGQCKHAGGFLGPVADWAANPGNVWCGNVFTDGTTSGMPTPVGCSSPTTTVAPSSTTSLSTTTTSLSTTTTVAPTTTTKPAATTTTVAPVTTTTIVGESVTDFCALHPLACATKG